VTSARRTGILRRPFHRFLRRTAILVVAGALVSAVVAFIEPIEGLRAGAKWPGTSLDALMVQGPAVGGLALIWLLVAFLRGPRRDVAFAAARPDAAVPANAPPMPKEYRPTVLRLIVTWLLVVSLVTQLVVAGVGLAAAGASRLRLATGWDARTGDRADVESVGVHFWPVDAACTDTVSPEARDALLDLVDAFVANGPEVHWLPDPLTGAYWGTPPMPWIGFSITYSDGSLDVVDLPGMTISDHEVIYSGSFDATDWARIGGLLGIPPTRPDAVTRITAQRLVGDDSGPAPAATVVGDEAAEAAMRLSLTVQGFAASGGPDHLLSDHAGAMRIRLDYADGSAEAIVIADARPGWAGEMTYAVELVQRNGSRIRARRLPAVAVGAIAQSLTLPPLPTPPPPDDAPHDSSQP
jgi:hypothetical protein